MLARKLTKTVKRLVGSGPLVSKVTRGGVWLGGGSVAEQGVRFIRNIILARLLAPQAFGEMAIVLSLASLVHTLTDMGVRESVIQNARGTEDNYITAAWWLGFGRSLSLYALLFLAAPFIGSFYHNPELVGLLRLATAAVLLDGACSAKLIVAIKMLNLKKVATVNHGGAIIGVTITIILCYFMRDVWALAAGYCVESAVRCGLSYWMWPHLPSTKWDPPAFRDLLMFSKGVFGLAFLNLLFARADVFVLAKLFPASEVGIYALAVNLVQTPVTFIMNLLGTTLLPAFSQVQEDNKRLNRMLFRITSVIILFGVPAIASVCFAGRSLLIIAYGPPYQAASGAMLVASAVALINLLNAQITIVLYAKGLPQLHRGSVAIMAASVSALMYPAIRHFGLVGAQLACLTAVIIGYLYQIIRVRRLTGFVASLHFKSLPHALVLSSCVIFVCLTGRTLLPVNRPVIQVILAIAGCAIACCVGIGSLLRREEQARG